MSLCKLLVFLMACFFLLAALTQQTPQALWDSAIEWLRACASSLT